MSRHPKTPPPGLQPDPDPIYHERRRGSLVFWLFVVIFPVGAAIRLWDGAQMSGSRTYGAVALGLVFYAFVLWGFLGPIGGEFKHLTVDRHGIWVRDNRLLPAHQIGHAEHLTDKQAAAATFSSRIDGTWLIKGVATFNWISSHGDAVFVRQHLPDGTTRPWLLATHHPQQLLDAIHQIRTPNLTSNPPSPQD